MKVVGIVGSPRRNGNTDTLVRAILEGAQSRNAETQTFHLNEMTIRGCQGCDYCKEHGACRLDDDMRTLHRVVEQADALVIGSPIYAAHVSAQTKLFLDRCYAFLDANMQSRLPEGKKFVMVYTYGDPGDRAYEGVVASVENMIKWFKPAYVNSIVYPGTTDKGSAARDSAFLKRARRIGEQLAE
jgi:multimeric flavodoxin WrbA